MILLYFAIPEYSGVMVMGRHLLDKGRLIVRGISITNSVWKVV